MQIDQKINWAILVTGWGQNAKDTIEADISGKLKKSKIALVIYENEPCGAKELAKKNRIETLHVARKDFPNMMEYQKHLILEIRKRNIDYIFLLNYKYIIKQEMLKSFKNKILNIHPSLFPSFLATKTAIQDALDYGVKVTGITTHFIDDKVDEGTILCQKVIKVKPNETFESIYPRFSKAGKKIILKTIKYIEKVHFKQDDDLNKSKRIKKS